MENTCYEFFFIFNTHMGRKEKVVKKLIVVYIQNDLTLKCMSSVYYTLFIAHIFTHIKIALKTWVMFINYTLFIAHIFTHMKIALKTWVTISTWMCIFTFFIHIFELCPQGVSTVKMFKQGKTHRGDGPPLILHIKVKF